MVSKDSNNSESKNLIRLFSKNIGGSRHLCHFLLQNIRSHNETNVSYSNMYPQDGPESKRMINILNIEKLLLLYVKKMNMSNIIRFFFEKNDKISINN